MCFVVLVEEEEEEALRELCTRVLDMLAPDRAWASSWAGFVAAVAAAAATTTWMKVVVVGCIARPPVQAPQYWEQEESRYLNSKKNLP